MRYESINVKVAGAIFSVLGNFITMPLTLILILNDSDDAKPYLKLTMRTLTLTDPHETNFIVIY